LKEIPDLIALHDAHKDKDLVVIVSSGFMNNPKLGHRFLSGHHRDFLFQSVLGNDAIVAQIGQCGRAAVTYMFNPQGKMVGVQRGCVDAKAVEGYIRQRSKLGCQQFCVLIALTPTRKRRREQYVQGRLF